MRVQGVRLGVRVERRGARVHDSGFHANQNIKCAFGVSGFWFLLSGFVFRVSDFGFCVSDFEFRISDLVLGFKFGVEGSGIRGLGVRSWL